MRVVINDMVAEDGKVAVYFTVQGTHEGDFMGIPATGARVSFEAFDLVRDGVRTEHWGVQDNAALMLQLGVGPPS